jgi:hypothetical protein
MKNLVIVNTSRVCDKCRLKGFFCNMPPDCITCPLCGHEDDDIDDDDYIYVEGSDDSFDWCPQCKILFVRGCTHAVEGCAFDIYNAHVISQWRDRYENLVHDGMPQFTDMTERTSRIKDIEILSMTCLNNGVHCINGSYPNDTTCDCSKA